MAFKLGDKLTRELKGEKAVMLTLTYDRTRYEGPRELYRQQREKRHVGRFINRLEKYLGRKLKGEWIRKLEFQKGGWTHWHIIIRGMNYIEHAELLKIWGHGHAFVTRASKTRLRYFAKYVAKPGDWPSFLLGERSRSVKLVATSPFFWRNTSAPTTDAVKPRARYRPKPWYIPLAIRFHEQRNRTVVHNGKYPRVHRVSYYDVISTAHDLGHVESLGAGWVAVPAAAVTKAESVRRDRAAIRRRTVHLTNVQDPPIPKTLQWVFEIIHEQIEFEREQERTAA